MLNFPVSKSIAIRYVLASFLANKTINLDKNISSDLKTSIKALKSIKNITNVGESGFLLRALPFILLLKEEKLTIRKKGTLKKRPSFLAEFFKKLDINFKETKDSLYINGKLKSGTYIFNNLESSQNISGLLMALPLLKEDSILKVKNLKSKSYIDLTLNVLKKFKISIQNKDYKSFYIKGGQTYKMPKNIKIEKDWSSASFLFVLAAISKKKIKIKDLNYKSLQGDKKILDILKLSRNCNSGFNFDFKDTPDLFPPALVLALFCKTPSKLSGISSLRLKESNRVEGLIKELYKLGAKIKVFKNHVKVYPSKLTGGKTLNSLNDHRVCMALSIASFNLRKKVKINDKKCVKKSYPMFFNDLKIFKKC
jgi:3-phosphoshikimate 1-carboxyvinyltransferase